MQDGDSTNTDTRGSFMKVNMNDRSNYQMLPQFPRLSFKMIWLFLSRTFTTLYLCSAVCQLASVGDVDRLRAISWKVFTLLTLHLYYLSRTIHSRLQLRLLLLLNQSKCTPRARKRCCIGSETEWRSPQSYYENATQKITICSNFLTLSDIFRS